ncbi:MAG: DNA-directed RNA polymerase subunit omega [Verrucomicrobia bacterium]|nr:DNA-directed RNA polymerase subunit omega [Verrucomicrobiota bacterium]MCH8511093.1 DNA-directed RNA polymerase subunit omega [Kiritimatiellia bacterium]
MNFEYLDAAVLRIPNKPLLINLVSRRVKQLNMGQRPMVKPDHPHQENLDIALKEVMEGLLDAEVVTSSKHVTEEEAAEKLLSL